MQKEFRVWEETQGALVGCRVRGFSGLRACT